MTHVQRDLHQIKATNDTNMNLSNAANQRRYNLLSIRRTELQLQNLPMFDSTFSSYLQHYPLCLKGVEVKCSAVGIDRCANYFLFGIIHSVVRESSQNETGC